MKKFYYLLAALLVIAVVVSLPGCGRTDSAKSANPLSGTWEYTDAEYDISTVYVLKDDGTGTYTMKVGDTEVVYELKYETKDDHLLVTYVNNEIFTEEDVFPQGLFRRRADLRQKIKISRSFRGGTTVGRSSFFLVLVPTRGAVLY